jgi:hypothetical protein
MSKELTATKVALFRASSATFQVAEEALPLYSGEWFRL